MTDQADRAACEAMAKEAGEGFWLASLLLPGDARRLADATNAFHTACQRSLQRAREPMAAQIRLRWWAEVANGEREAEAGGDPLGRMLGTLRAQLPTLGPALERKADAHAMEVEATPFADRSQWEGWAGDVFAGPLKLRFLQHDDAPGAPVDDACGHLGCALGAAHLLATFARRRASGQLPMPADLAAALGLAADITAWDEAEARSAATSLCELGQDHLTKAKAAVPELPRGTARLLPEFGLTAAALRHHRAGRAAILGEQPAQWRLQWALLRRSFATR